MSSSAPGLFWFLREQGVMTEESLAPLLSRLGPERYCSSPARGGQAYDSTRWPLARDVALARWIAGRDDDLAVARALAELAAADVDLTRLRALARVAYARMIAACGGDTSMFTQLCTDATPADLAVFAEPRGDAATAGVIAELCSVHHAAADGLYAYHVHRRIPGPSAEAAARLAQGRSAWGASRCPSLWRPRWRCYPPRGPDWRSADLPVESAGRVSRGLRT